MTKGSGNSAKKVKKINNSKVYRKVSIVSAPLILRISRSSSAYIREGEGAYYTVLVKKRVSDNRIIVSIALSANISYLGGGGGGGGAEEAYIQFF